VKVEKQVKKKKVATPVDMHAHAIGPLNLVILPKATPHRQESNSWMF
jgi:hypothetical protein